MKRPLAGLLAVVLSGCVSVSKEGGHDKVARIIGERLGQQTHWEAGAPEEVQIRLWVDEQLRAGLTRERAVAIALINNPTLQQTYDSLDISQAEMVQAGLLKNPILVGHYAFPLGPSGPEIQASLVQDFLDLFVLPLRKSIAADQFAIDTQRVASSALAIASEVAKAYAAVQAGQQLVEMRRQVAGAAQNSADLAERIFSAGNSSVRVARQRPADGNSNSKARNEALPTRPDQRPE